MPLSHGEVQVIPADDVHAGPIPVSISSPTIQAVSGTITANQGASGTVPWLTTPVAKVITASFTRPADTTAYSVFDALSDSTSTPSPITFTGCARTAGSGGRIISALLIDSANQSTIGNFNLFLFDTAPSGQVDNSQIALTDAELEKCIGVIPFDVALTILGNPGSGASGNRIYGQFAGAGIQVSPNLAFLTTNTADLYGVIMVGNSYTPVSAEKFTIRLGIEQD